MAGERDEHGRFLKGPGRKPGSRNRVSKLSPVVTSLRGKLEAAAPEVIDRVLELAKGGDMGAIKLVVDRVYPVLPAQLEAMQMQVDELREQLEARDASVVNIDARWAR